MHLCPKHAEFRPSAPFFLEGETGWGGGWGLLLEFTLFTKTSHFKGYELLVQGDPVSKVVPAEPPGIGSI